MLNKQEKPTLKEITNHCGKNGELFQLIHEFLSNDYHTSQEIRFPYGKDYGWGITHRKGKKLICDVFAEADAFTVMLRMSNQQYQSVYHEVSSYAKEYIDHKYPCKDGGWIQYRVFSEEHMEDIKRMLSVKCS